jgi:shikimate kinase
MSGSGKSHWSKKLGKHGFERFCCDDLISRKLGGRLRLPDGRLQDLGEWMGMPYETGYEEHEKEYLSLEMDVLENILRNLESGTTNDDVVVDTTGSVIYTGEDNLRRLRKLTTVVHFRTPPEVQDFMLQNYLKKQRPVLWQGMFQKEAGETNEEALARCYALLLSAREEVYIRLAHVSIDYEDRRREDFTIKNFIDTVNRAR